MVRKDVCQKGVCSLFLGVWLAFVWELLSPVLIHWWSTWGKVPVSPEARVEAIQLWGRTGWSLAAPLLGPIEGLTATGKDLWLEIPPWWCFPLQTWNLLIWVSNLLPFLYSTFLLCQSFCHHSFVVMPFLLWTFQLLHPQYSPLVRGLFLWQAGVVFGEKLIHFLVMYFLVHVTFSWSAVALQVWLFLLLLA